MLQWAYLKIKVNTGGFRIYFILKFFIFNKYLLYTMKHLLDFINEHLISEGNNHVDHINMNLNSTVKVSAPVISDDEFLNHMREIFNEYGEGERQHEFDNKKQGLVGCFIHDFCTSFNKNQDWARNKNSKLHQLVYDLSWINYDSENIDAFSSDIQHAKDVPYIIGEAGGDWEEPFMFIVYWDGTQFRAYIPWKGNCFRADKKVKSRGAIKRDDAHPLIGNDDEGDTEFIRKQTGKDTSSKNTISIDKNACIEEFINNLTAKK